jgi:hypothetical protein
VILSVHLADVGMRAAPALLRRRPDPSRVPGLRYAELAVAAPLQGRLLPRPRPGRVGLIAAWDDDAALDGFLRAHPLAERLAGGWRVRLEPLRASGAWPPLPTLAGRERAVEDDEPVAVLTLGRLRFARALPFLRARAAAEAQLETDPAVTFSTGLARPPGFVATFSLWRTAREMRAYAYGGSGPEHRAAIDAHRANAFHHDSAFARFRPYAADGTLPA